MVLNIVFLYEYHQLLSMRFILYLFTLGFLFTFSDLNAQITVTNETFPAVGDILKTVSATNVEGLVMTPAGDDQFWDFSNIQTNAVSELNYVGVNEGENAMFFPTANLLITDEQGENYFEVSDQTVNFLGFSGGDPTGFGVELVALLDPPLTEARAPLTYLDFDSYSSETNIPFAADAIPGGILDSLPLSPDSLRIRVMVDRTDLIDAWGTIKIPGNKEYEVIRRKRVELSETRLDIKLGIFPWVDVTDQLGDMGFFGGIDTLVTYTFISNDAKENIAVFDLDGDEEFIFGADFKFEQGGPNSISTTQNGDPGVFAYPNPAINEVKFDFRNLENGTYQLKIFNILGLEALNEEVYVSGNKTIKSDISRLKKGTYLYSLIDDSGKTISTKRLIVVRP